MFDDKDSATFRQWQLHACCYYIINLFLRRLNKIDNIITQSLLPHLSTKVRSFLEICKNLSYLFVSFIWGFWTFCWYCRQTPHERIRVFLKKILEKRFTLQLVSISCLPEDSHRLRISSWMARVLRQWPGPWVNIFKAFKELPSLHILHGSKRVSRTV